MAAARKGGGDAPAKKATGRSGTGGRGAGTAPRTHLALGIPLAALSGCLVFLSFPDFDLFPLQWFSLVPLLVALRGRSFRGGLGLGFVAGIVTNFGGFHWISELLREFGHMSPGPAWAITGLMAAYQGLQFALAGGLAGAITSRWRWLPWGLVLPFTLVGAENAIPFLFPWYFGNGQLHFPLAIQVADVLGVAGVSFVLALFNGGLGEVLTARLDGRRFPWATAVLALVAVGADLGYGAWRIPQVDAAVAAGPKYRVGVVEADVGIWEKDAKNPDGTPLAFAEQVRVLYRNLLRHQVLSAALERDAKPDLIVWPESSYMPLRDVNWRRTDDVAVAASADGRLWRVQPGDARKVEDPGADLARASGLRAVAAVREDQWLAVGPRGAAYAFNGTAWSRETTGTDRDLLAVAVRPDDGAAVAVGAQGTALLRTAGTWKAVDPATTQTLRGVAYVEGRGFVACGDGGTLVQLDRKGARPLVAAEAGAPDLQACAAGPDRSVVAVGQAGTVMSVARDGTVSRQAPVSGTLRGVAAGRTTAWAVGDGGTVLACGGECRKVASNTRRDLRAVTVDLSGRAFASGEGGVLLALSEDKVHPVKGADGDLLGLASVPFDDGYPLPQDVRHLYVPEAPLPAKSLDEDLLKAVDADTRTPDRDRNAAQRGFRTPLLFGVVTSRPDESDPAASRDFNSALLVDADGTVRGRYDKNLLLLFGEYLPLADTFPFLRKWLPEAGDFTPGRDVSVLSSGDARLGVLICYEGILPAFTRRVARLDPNLLVNLTNDAWFGRTAEPDLHMQLAAFRAVEHRRFFVRSTNTGVSVVVDPVGRVLHRTSLSDPESFVADTVLLEGETIYRRFGDLFAWGCLGLSLLLGGVAVLTRRS
jgi:apolipoprotein N-acyltransferase